MTVEPLGQPFGNSLLYSNSSSPSTKSPMYFQMAGLIPKPVTKSNNDLKQDLQEQAKASPTKAPMNVLVEESNDEDEDIPEDEGGEDLDLGLLQQYEHVMNFGQASLNVITALKTHLRAEYHWYSEKEIDQMVYKFLNEYLAKLSLLAGTN